jgi:DNA-binding transcriptional LysR family regulator
MRGVTLAQLRAFTVVAKHLSFGKAADELCVTPPAVSMQIKELELSLEVCLFRREGSRVSLTTPGESLLFYVRRVFATLADAASTLAGIKGVVHGALTIGVVPTGSYFVPRFLARFLADHPCAEPRVIVGGRSKVIDMLGEQAIDLAVMARAPDDASIDSVPFAPLLNVLVASREHPLASRPRIPVGELTNCRFIVREEGSETRDALERYLVMLALSPSRLTEMGSNEAVKQAVIANLGVGFLPWEAVRLEYEKQLVSVLPVCGPRVIDRWHLAHHRNHGLSPVAEAFRYALMEEGERFVRCGWPVQ